MRPDNIVCIVSCFCALAVAGFAGWALNPGPKINHVNFENVFSKTAEKQMIWHNYMIGFCKASTELQESDAMFFAKCMMLMKDMAEKDTK